MDIVILAAIVFGLGALCGLASVYLIDWLLTPREVPMETVIEGCKWETQPGAVTLTDCVFISRDGTAVDFPERYEDRQNAPTTRRVQ